MLLSQLSRAVVLLALFPCALHAQDEAQRYRTGAIKEGDRVLADAVGLGTPDTCTVIGTSELTGSYMPGYTNQYLIRCDHKAWVSVSATADRVKLAGQPNVLQSGRANANNPPPGSNAWGTRNPATCSSLKSPSLTAELARRAFICGAEGERGGLLYLVENVRLEIGGPTRYNPNTQTGFERMDTRSSPYAIRGSFLQYQCSRVDLDFRSAFNNAGKNCNTYSNRNAEGYCYKTVFGDWNCSMNDSMKTEADKHFRVGPPR